MKHNSFAFMADLLREWLGQARTAEIADVLELVGHELRRRGITLRRETGPPPR